MRRREDDVNRKLYLTTLNNLKAKGIDVDLSIIEEVCKSKWEFIAYVIRFGQRESYRDKYMGNWGVKRWKPACQERKYLTEEEYEKYNSIEDSLEKLKWLDNHHKEFHELHKFERNKLYFPVIMTDKKGNETEFNTLKECSEFTNIDPIHIYISCSKKTKTKKGLSFRFAKHDNQKEEGNN